MNKEEKRAHIRFYVSVVIIMVIAVGLSLPFVTRLAMNPYRIVVDFNRMGRQRMLTMQLQSYILTGDVEDARQTLDELRDGQEMMVQRGGGEEYSEKLGRLKTTYIALGSFCGDGTGPYEIRRLRDCSDDYISAVDDVMRAVENERYPTMVWRRLWAVVIGIVTLWAMTVSCFVLQARARLSVNRESEDYEPYERDLGFDKRPGTD